MIVNLSAVCFLEASNHVLLVSKWDSALGSRDQELLGHYASPCSSTKDQDQSFDGKISGRMSFHLLEAQVV